MLENFYSSHIYTYLFLRIVFDCEFSIGLTLHLSRWNFPFLLEEVITSTLGLGPDSGEELSDGTLEGCNHLTLVVYLKLEK